MNPGEGEACKIGSKSSRIMGFRSKITPRNAIFQATADTWRRCCYMLFGVLVVSVSSLHTWLVSHETISKKHFIFVYN